MCDRFARNAVAIEIGAPDRQASLMPPQLTEPDRREVLDLLMLPGMLPGEMLDAPRRDAGERAPGSPAMG